MFDESDALGNALAVDTPARKLPPGFWAGSGTALLTGIGAGVLDVGSAMTSIMQLRMSQAKPSADRDASQQAAEEEGVALRSMAKRLTPSADASGEAASIIHGFSRVLAKAVPLALAGGLPAAALGTGAVEGTVEAQRLQDEGVDPATATKIGTTKAALIAGQIALPMSAATKLGTVALVAAGGPGGFMAEQAASRWILDNADYGEIARRYDPLDPVGLTVATLMAGTFGVAGHVMRARRPEITPEMQAAARVEQMVEHAQDTGLHEPKNLAGAVAHVDALESAVRSVDAGEPVNVGDIVRPEMLGERGQAALESAQEYAWRHRPVTEAGGGARLHDLESAKGAGEAASAGAKVADLAQAPKAEAPDAIETAAREAALKTPDAMVPHPETGELLPAKQILADADQAHQAHMREASAYQVAVNCFLGR